MNSDDKNHNFKAKANGLSYFAIGIKSAPETIATGAENLSDVQKQTSKILKTECRDIIRSKNTSKQTKTTTQTEGKNDAGLMPIMLLVGALVTEQ